VFCICITKFEVFKSMITCVDFFFGRATSFMCQEGSTVSELHAISMSTVKKERWLFLRSVGTHLLDFGVTTRQAAIGTQVLCRKWRSLLSHLCSTLPSHINCTKRMAWESCLNGDSKYWSS
jgi:hypothetical protein